MARSALYISPSREVVFASQMQTFLESGDWSQATPSHIVALYKWCHKEIYGVDALEVKGQEFALATQVAKNFAIREFGNDYSELVAFIRWTWHREGEREAWRRNNSKEGKRIGWRLQFNASLLTDYRLHLARHAKVNPG